MNSKNKNKLKESQTNQNEIQTDRVPTAGSIFLKATLLSLFFVLIMLFITALGVFGFGYYKLNQFTKQADTSISELEQIVTTGIATTPKQTDSIKTILVLGVDSVENKPDSPLLTDTIMLISINLKTGQINTLSLPRDLWSLSYQTRINALYEYGQERYPERPEQFPEEVIAELTGLDIHHTIVLSLENVRNIIDILGGIKIDVPQSFTDTEFPREDVDIANIKNKNELYETITFEKGLQYMDGETVLKYMRSRKSADLTQGTDIARSNRQQQVISSLIQRMSNFSILKNIDTLAELYRFYNDNFEKQFSKIEAISTLNTLIPVKDSINLKGHSLSIYPEDENGVITNPPLYKYNGQWVYEIINPEEFKTEVENTLKE